MVREWAIHVNVSRKNEKRNEGEINYALLVGNVAFFGLAPLSLHVRFLAANLNWESLSEVKVLKHSKSVAVVDTVYVKSGEFQEQKFPETSLKLDNSNPLARQKTVFEFSEVGTIEYGIKIQEIVKILF